MVNFKQCSSLGQKIRKKEKFSEEKKKVSRKSISMESFLAFEFFIKLYYFLVASSFSFSFCSLRKMSKTSLKKKEDRNKLM